jgi:uncharacterized membrane protein
VDRLIHLARAVAGVALVVTYEMGAHYAVSTPGMHGVGLALALAPLMAATFGAAVRSDRRAWLLPLWSLGCVALWVARAPLAHHFVWGLFFEHVSFNLAMAVLFGHTLLRGREPLCSRYACLVHGPLTPAVARYTRRITAAWMLFFIAMAGASTLLFALTSIVSWSTFANYLILPLVALMFIAEYGCRRLVLPGEARSGIFDGVRAYRQLRREHAIEMR